ncbi:hypothetical protein SAMN04489742_4898 [Arthrobacter crystallopoietes]|uniref:Uncharacterized protein n=1 Tax=Crystallibacter crystallopoietes TaxID=37928 RepID=A0A1H1I108_9MICC|nr:hypothetical protein SAMN04489742_4898 [Arthrobacter crystallopoietes]
MEVEPGSESQPPMRQYSCEECSLVPSCGSHDFHEIIGDFSSLDPRRHHVRGGGEVADGFDGGIRR